MIGSSDPKSYVEQRDTDEIILELTEVTIGETFLGETEIVEICRGVESHLFL